MKDIPKLNTLVKEAMLHNHGTDANHYIRSAIAAYGTHLAELQKLETSQKFIEAIDNRIDAEGTNLGTEAIGELRLLQDWMEDQKAAP